MNFLQKTLLTALPCVMLGFAPASAQANDSLNNFIDSLTSGQTQAQTFDKAWKPNR